MCMVRPSPKPKISIMITANVQKGVRNFRLWRSTMNMHPTPSVTVEGHRYVHHPPWRYALSFHGGVAPFGSASLCRSVGLGDDGMAPRCRRVLPAAGTRGPDAKQPTENVPTEHQTGDTLGFFNVAESYWQAALTLKKSKLNTTHPDSPIYFLYYHAIELYLKAFLRRHGHSERELRSKRFGHKTCCLTERASELGLFFVDEDLIVFSLMATTDAVIRSRYLQTGYFHWPTLEALDRTCRSLRESVGRELKTVGIPVRLPT
jgi:hypothetical protein